MFEDFELNEMNYNEHKNECDKIKESYGDDSKWKNCYIDELEIGDIIYVEYLPYSQKYLYYHTPECGLVNKIIYNSNGKK